MRKAIISQKTSKTCNAGEQETKKLKQCILIVRNNIRVIEKKQVAANQEDRKKIDGVGKSTKQ